MSQSSEQEVSIRRAPKYLQFVLTGFVLGIIVALIFGFSSPDVVGLLIVLGGIIGLGFGAILALIFDAYYRRRGRELQATKITE